MPTKTFKRVRSFLVVAFTGSLSFSSALAHEFIIKPAQFSAQPVSTVAFSVLASHVFMVSDEMEPLHTVKAWLHVASQRTPISLHENRGAKTLDGEALLTANDIALLASYLEEPIETRAAAGGKAGAKIKREKWSKTLLSGGSPDQSYEKILGHKLEIVPLSNPLSLKTVSELAVKILLDGKPLTTMVYATHDGFSRRDNTYAYASESKEGIAHIKFSQAVAWMVRVENRQQVTYKDFNERFESHADFSGSVVFL